MNKKLLLLIFLISTFTTNYAQTTSGSDWTVSNLTNDHALTFPWEITYGPDDFLWVTERTDRNGSENPGQRIVRVDPNTGDIFEMIDLDAEIKTAKQGGLMGMAIHPALYEDISTTTNNYVFVAYTYLDGNSDLKLRIARLIYNNSTHTLTPDTSLNSNGAILEGLPGSEDHNSGRLVIGTDEKLYYTIGDQGANQFEYSCDPNLAQVLPTSSTDYDHYPGKTLRLNTDGSIPSDNPVFNGVQSHVNTYGHRNAQGIIIANDGTIYISEHGPKTDDEINIIKSGKNYGWPEIAGYYDNAAYSYCNWSTANNCNAGDFSDHNCPSGAITRTEFESFPNGAPADFEPPIGTYGSTSTVDPSGGWFTWPTPAVSSIDIHETGNIPGWGRSLLIPSLKKGTIYRAKLTPDGEDIVDDYYEEFHSSNDRYRDIAISPDGLTIYAVTDNSGGTSGPSTNSGQSIENPGVIVVLKYVGEVVATNPPVASCQDITVTLDENGNAVITATDIDNGSTAVAPATIISTTIDIDTFDCSHVGTPQTVTLTVTDSDGAQAICSATVSVEANSNPATIDTPILDDIVGVCSITVDAPIAFSNSCEEIIATTTDETTFVAGENAIITWEFDDNGTIVTATQNVTVNALTIPTNLIVSQGVTSASVSWDEILDVTYEIRYRETGSATWITSSSSTNSYTLSTLNADTTYEIQVQSICDNGSSEFSESVLFTTTSADYCTPIVEYYDDVFYINNVTLLDSSGTELINNSSTASDDVEGYSDYSDSVTIPNLEVGDTFDIEISLLNTHNWNKTTGHTIWIDYNQNGTFESNEIVWGTTEDLDLVPHGEPAQGTFTIPTSALSGNTRMRIVSRTYDTATDPCDIALNNPTDNGAEVEDYTLNITSPNAQPIITSATNLSAIEDGIDVSGAIAFTDADSEDSHTFSVSSLPAGSGTVTIDTNGEYIYSIGSNFQDLAEGEETTVNFDVTVTDNFGGSDTATITVTITGANDAPSAVCQNVSIQLESGSATVLPSQIDNGSSDDDNIVSYTLDTDTFTTEGIYDVILTVTDTNGLTDTCTSTVTVTNEPINNNPIASNNSTSTQENTPVIIDVLGNDSDSDGDSLVITEINGTSISEGSSVSTTNASVSLISGQLEITPITNNTINFEYTISDGNGGTATASVTVLVIIPVEYCTAQGVSGNGRITNVQISGENGTSLDNSSSNNTDYSDFTNISPVELEVENTYSMTISNGTTTNSGYAVWIDYNQDGDFTDANEEVYKSTSGSLNGTGSINIDVAIPEDATSGNTRMRIAMRYWWSPGGPCGDIVESGQPSEVEDYTVNISTGVVDADNDGFNSDVDCDDNDAAVNPAADEVLYDGIDNDCNPDTLDTIDADNDGFNSDVDCDDNDSAINPDTIWYLDADNDGFASSTIASCTNPGTGYTLSVLPVADCDDNDAAINPDATEVLYDGIDNDCNPDTLDTVDADNDGANSDVDCDDNDATVNPNAEEILYDGIDNDCNPDTLDTVDADNDGFNSDVDCDDNDATVNPAADEVLYDGIDNDCNPDTLDTIDADNDGFNSDVDCDDNDSAINPDTVWYLDADNDGFASSTIASCTNPGTGYTLSALPVADCDDNDAAINPDATEVLYDGIDNDCNPATADTVDADNDGANSDVDCDDSDATVNPNAEEILYDGIDNDCNPDTLDTIDADNDGFNSDVDCDDNDATVNPDADEVLYDGIDNDCNPDTLDTIDADNDGFNSDVDCDDNDSAINPDTVWYLDADNDGFASSTIASCTNPGTGYTLAVLPVTDCDDNDAAINPDATEVHYDGIDNDCNPATADTVDADNDGVNSDVDCDDNDATVNPNAEEILYDGIDNDCNPDTLDTVDADNDGFNSDVDCDDNDATVNPAADEVLYDGIDNDCNPDTLDTIDADNDGFNSDVDCDDNDSAINPDTVWYLDADNDGFASSTIASCTNPGTGYTLSALPVADCDDNDAAINPDATEVLYDGIDNDCNPDTLDTVDADNDGVNSDVDCDDSDATVNPNAEEILYDGIDNDCNPDTLDTVDADNDGFNSDVDCDDNDATVNPAADEVLYDGIDNDCNPDTLDTIDADNDGFNSDVDCDDNDSAINPDTVWYLDADNDGFASSTIASCTNPGTGYTLSALPVADCDDNDAAINPDATEVLYDGIDNDCNPDTLDTVDADNDGVNSDVDCDDNDATVNPNAEEILYDGIDNDCNPDTLDTIDADNDGFNSDVDCDDNDATVNPAAEEIPYNGIDDDCDPKTLDDDLDNDGYKNDQDCDDTNSSINPGATEIIGNGVDDDCNSATSDDPAPAANYCEPSNIGDYDSGFYITNFELGTINNSTGANRPTRYSDFTNTDSTTLNLGSSNTFNLTNVGAQWGGGDLGLNIWIDFNKDGDFEDSNELVYEGALSSQRNRTGTINIPSSVSSGSTRMRVAVKSWGIPTPCWDWGAGEIEDYTVVITSGSQSRSTFVNSFNSDNTENETNELPNTKIYLIEDKIHVSMGKTENAQLTIFNMLGQQILSEKLNDKNYINLPKNTSKGIYIVQLKSEFGTINKRILVRD
ncbi:MopE-related protein [Urechidicola croceus]|uniref:Fibronectin type-III domain-containing protein n=1 Tax=Urechidicola croceus TaxID=1850246 RepID=A0A1D8P8X3_9FLAO|nr:MopE-related protein [Urechidicola croceus]AOW21043.1 hypothetical protein LPB138_10280 [Urechidicola croceus]